MKTSKTILGIVILAALFTSIVLTSCQKEDDDLIMEETPDTSIISAENAIGTDQPLMSSEISSNDMSAAKIGVFNDCKKVGICGSNGKLKNVSTNAAFTHLENGGMLFDCNPDVGLDLTEVTTILTPRIIANGGDFTSTADLKDEFLVWFYEAYCPADDGGPNNDEGDGGVFDGDAGSNL
jgi:hypothetical protein